jgi:hypothetical protein
MTFPSLRFRGGTEVNESPCFLSSYPFALEGSDGLRKTKVMPAVGRR